MKYKIMLIDGKECRAVMENLSNNKAVVDKLMKDDDYHELAHWMLEKIKEDDNPCHQAMIGLEKAVIAGYILGQKALGIEPEMVSDEEDQKQIDLMRKEAAEADEKIEAATEKVKEAIADLPDPIKNLIKSITRDLGIEPTIEVVKIDGKTGKEIKFSNKDDDATKPYEVAELNRIAKLGEQESD